MSQDYIPLEGKPVRKERKERVNTTVFVSSLPYNATTTDLITHFSFIGPVRHGFVATDKDTGKSKGVGYVTYSLEEDAVRAVEELEGGEFGDKGRKIRVSMADKKPPPPPRGERVEAPARPKVVTSIETSDNAAPSDPNAIRTLVLSGLPEGITKAVLWKKVRKVNGNVELVYPVPGEETAHLIFPSHNDAMTGIGKLHGATYKDSLLSCVLKKRMDKLSAKGEGKAPSHAGRLIIRNLTWDTTVKDLRATFLKFGPIHSIDLPTLPSILPASADPSRAPPPPRARGFAFVWFLAKSDAEKAMAEINGKVIKKVDAVEGAGPATKKEPRPVAVDWALSKDKWKETQKDVADEGSGDEESGSSSGSGSASGSGSDDDDENSEDNEEEEDEESEGEAQDTGDIDMEDTEEPVKPKLPTVDVSTLFIRNLPFETTEQELGELTFGPLRYARITMDKMTGRSRGSGFVCFWNTEHADAAMVESEKVAQETGANSQPLGGGRNPFALPSVLTVDPSSSLASRLVLHGRTLDVSRAVTREEAGQMKEDGEKARERGDKRNTYLMREGVVFPNSPAAAALPVAEVEKRQAAFNARRTLLKSNPSLYISKTRLSIRQLPLFASDRTLKRLGIHAVRAFDDEVNSGDRKALERAEEIDTTLSPAIAAREASGKKKKGERETSVVQSKIVRQTEKLDPLTGLGKSKGYGFLEMRSHKDALKMLRWANNNENVGQLMWEWWKVEMGELVERTKTQLKLAREKAEKAKTEGAASKEEKEGESIEDLEARLKKLENRVAEGDDRSSGGMRGGKTLMIEFSIENVQVVKRRVEKVVMPRRREEAGERQGRDSRDGRDGDRNGDFKRKFVAAVDSDDEGAKRPKGKRDDKKSSSRVGKGKVEASKPVAAVEEKKGLEKMGNQLGSMIGRKRKMRKGN